jgi:endonuclease/exonuclease/phosphatase family metal-dependent hydrolase
MTITIAFYNLENAFDVFDDPYTADEISDVKQRGELKAIAAAIREMNPDVITFSELENVHVLRAMASDFLSDAGYRYIASNPTNSSRGINMGIISRLPIESITSYRFAELTLPNEKRTWHYARDLMRVTLRAPNGEPLDIFTVHFKSKRDAASDPNSKHWRLAEALGARRTIDAILVDRPDAMIALVGDFNDTPDSEPIGALLADEVLHDVHDDLPKKAHVTYLKKKYRSTIDYILVSGGLAKRYIAGSAAVLHNKKLLHGSDHAPIWATFEFKNT